ncbi:MAG: branched-chain amino acid ABC transporter permease [Xanthobacteraceae bacterium]|nr:branched-chain amino acid ABC transporter permease [Xanthobacteraceae bacterium]MBV9626650.1 branched-chain amino acid ABC transporter permease [Xanthobacteraceae bacterium]
MSMVGQGALDAVPLWRRSVRDARIALVVAVILALLIALPFGLTRYQVGLATEILIYGILAMSIDILAGFAGRTSLAHGALFGVSAYVVLYAVSTLGFSPALAVLLGVVAATATAALFALVAARTAGVYFLLLTLALGMIVWGICLRWTDVTGGENGLRGNLRMGSLRDYAVFYWVVLGCAAAASFAMWRLVRSPFGLTLRGIRDSESRMRSLGYNVYLHLVVGFTISGLFAGIAGALYAFFNSFVSPTTVALTQSVQGLLMAITGGIGTLFGAFIGSATILMLENVVSSYTERWQTVLGLTFIFVMIFAPEGIVGKLGALLARAGRKSTN